jgi:hypothetical protein
MTIPACLVAAAMPVLAADGEPEDGLTRVADGVFEAEHRDAAGAVEGSTTVVVGERMVVVVESCFGTPGVRQDVIRIRPRGDDPLDLVVDTRSRDAGQASNRVHLEAHSGMRIVSRVDRRKEDPPGALERLRAGFVDPFLKSLVDELRSHVDHARSRASMALESARQHWS